jgi:hypothetical protein
MNGNDREQAGGAGDMQSTHVTAGAAQGSFDSDPNFLIHFRLFLFKMTTFQYEDIS